MSDFIEYLKRDVVNEGGKADLWDSDINFTSSLIGAPNKEDIKPGKIFTEAKKKEAVQAIRLPEGSVFEGATGQPQTAGEKGAYLIKDSAGMRMIQTEEFSKAYSITKNPNTMTNTKERDF